MPVLQLLILSLWFEEGACATAATSREAAENSGASHAKDGSTERIRLFD